MKKLLRYWRPILILVGNIILFWGLIYHTSDKKYNLISASIIAIGLIGSKEMNDPYIWKLFQFYGESLGLAVIGGGMVVLVTPPSQNYGGSIILAGTIMLLFGVYLRTRIYKFETEVELGNLKRLKKKK